MATTIKKRRINITTEPDIESALQALAKRDSIPMTTKAEELLRIGLEVEEDMALVQIATQRADAIKPAAYIPHGKVW